MTAKRCLLAAISTLAVAVFAAGLGWLSLGHEPAFYVRAKATPDAQLERSSDEFLRNATALASQVNTRGRWSARFTADEINGWLAEDLVRNHPGLLDDAVTDPRVEIRDGQLSIACTYTTAAAQWVLSFELAPSVTAPNELAVGIHRVRAGAVPLPLGMVLDAVTRAAEDANVRLRWRREGGEPVALVTLSLDQSAGHAAIDTIELRDGAIYLAGSTTDESRDGYEPEPPRPSLASRDSAEKDSDQR